MNEIFKPELGGKDLQLSLLQIVNKIKEEQKYPEKLKYADIT